MIKKTKMSELSEFGPSKYLDGDEGLRFFYQSQQQLDEGMSAITPRTPLDPPLQGAHWLASQCRSAGMQHAA